MPEAIEVGEGDLRSAKLAHVHAMGFRREA